MARGGRAAWAPGIPRLGINPYPWGTECLRGDVDAGPATAFPQAVGLAATFRYVDAGPATTYIYIFIHNVTNNVKECPQNNEQKSYLYKISPKQLDNV